VSVCSKTSLRMYSLNSSHADSHIRLFR